MVRSEVETGLDRLEISAEHQKVEAVPLHGLEQIVHSLEEIRFSWLEKSHLWLRNYIDNVFTDITVN